MEEIFSHAFLRIFWKKNIGTSAWNILCTCSKCYHALWWRPELAKSKQNLLFRFLYFLKVKWSLEIFPLRFLQQPKTNITALTNNSSVLWLKNSCHKILILGKHILCLHKIAIMEPISIISVIYELNRFTNSSVKGHLANWNWYLLLSFSVKKSKVTLESDAKKKTTIFQELSFAYDSTQETKKYTLFVSPCRLWRYQEELFQSKQQ